MEIDAVYFANNEPCQVTLTVTVEQLAWITQKVGEYEGPHLADDMSEFYHDVTGHFFNKFYEDGIEEWKTR